MKRRSLRQLKRAVANAPGKPEKAVAFFDLGAFHDNNGREATAVPNYQNAIRLGLDREREAMARAWLASSLFKTKRFRAALKEISAANKLPQTESLRQFLLGLEKRIRVRI